MVRMRSPVQIWLSAPRRTTSIPDVVFFALYAKRLLRNLCVAVACVRLTQAQAFGSSRLAIISTCELGTSFFLRYTQNGCCATSARLWPAFDSLKRKRLVRLAWPSSPRANLGRRFFCVTRKTVATQPLRGCGLRSTHSSASVWFVSLGHHLHVRTWDVVLFCVIRKTVAAQPLRGLSPTHAEKMQALFRLCLWSFPLNAPQGAVLFCVIRKTVAAQPLRGLSSAHAEKMQALFRLSFRSLSRRFLTCIRNDKERGSARDCPRPTKRSRFA